MTDVQPKGTHYVGCHLDHPVCAYVTGKRAGLTDALRIMSRHRAELGRMDTPSAKGACGALDTVIGQILETRNV